MILLYQFTFKPLDIIKAQTILTPIEERIFADGIIAVEKKERDNVHIVAINVADSQIIACVSERDTVSFQGWF